jgi:Ni,Fe-hydrogenase III large subunit
VSAPRAAAASAAQWVEVVDVRPRTWPRACAEEVERGGRFCGAYAGGAGGGRHWNALFASGAGTRVLRVPVERGEIGTVVDLVGAAGWDEREAHDLHGLRFAGHEPLRALVDHPAETEAWTVPVRGRGVHQVAVGPVHAGVIESGHFRFHAVGERIVHLDVRLFHKHRGLERAAAGREPAEALAYAQRACGACAVANSVAYAQACEAALGLASPGGVRRARTVLLELERLYNHLNDVAAICAGVGFAPGSMAFAALKERAMRLNCELSGHRFLFGSVGLGTSAVELDAAAVDRARGLLGELGADTARAWRELAFSGSVRARLGEVGRLAREDAERLGAVGPAARASGLRIDARGESPGLCYGSGFAAAAPARPRGDVAARLEIRGVELVGTLELLDELLEEPLMPGRASQGGPPGRLGVARVESPRGETVCAVELDGGTVARLRLRTASYANWPALAEATAGNLLPDFPLINKSFELCYACVDR